MYIAYARSYWLAGCTDGYRSRPSSHDTRLYDLPANMTFRMQCASGSVYVSFNSFDTSLSYITIIVKDHMGALANLLYVLKAGLS